MSITESFIDAVAKIGELLSKSKQLPHNNMPLNNLCSAKGFLTEQFGQKKLNAILDFLI